jgi:hypothetical protein
MAEIVAAVREWTGAEARPEERLFRWVVPASCLLHVALAAMLSLSPESRPVDAPSDAVAVEVLTAEEFAALSGASGRVPEIAAPVERTPPARGGMVRATRLFAEELLADPKSRQARETLPTLAADERMLQLCNIEAMEQVHRWKAEYEPEFVVAYATADTRIAGNAVEADGGAFRSHDRWYGIRFECEVSPDLARVVAFAFSVGAAIPRSEWERRNLPTAVDPDD